uniref:Uncharacterized protein n=1 Tax=Chenopodium quinoa TaxID=63459 RepID=A0A803LHJ0_CHEQI
MSIFEGSDLLLDMETNACNKKRRRGESFVTAPDNKADEDYVSFLEGLQQFWEAKFVEDDDVDPTYMEFLGNLKEYNNAYMCDVSIENGVLSPIYYEDEYESPNLMKRKTSQPCCGTVIHEKRNLHQDVGLKSTRKNSGVKDNSCDVFPRSLDAAENPKSGWKNSKAGNVSDGFKRKTPISRRGDRARENRILYIDRNQKSSDSRNDHLEENRSLDMDSDQSNSDSENVRPYGNKRKTPHSSKGNCVRENRKLDVDSDQILGPKYSGSGKKMSIIVDETYETFLNSLHITEDSVIYEYGDLQRISYEPNDQQKTGVRIKKDTRPPSLTRKPTTPIPVPQTPPSRAKITSQKKSTPTDSLNTLSTSNKTCKKGKIQRVDSSEYWYLNKELHRYLRRPYERKEFDELLAEFNSKKPVSIYRDSRSGGSYRPGHMGKSLLEKFPGKFVLGLVD